MTPPTSPLTEGPFEHHLNRDISGPVELPHDAIMGSFNGDALCNLANNIFAAGVAHATATQSARVTDLEAKNEALVKALNSRLRHGSACAVWFSEDICNCGALEAALPTPTEPGKDKP